MWFRVALTALLLGFAGDFLLRHVPWGLGTLVWTILFVSATLVLIIQYRRQALRDAIFPAIACVIAASGMVWRASLVLFLLDVILLLIFLPFLALGARGVRTEAAGLMRFIVAHIVTLAQSVAGFFELLVHDIAWSSIPRGTTSRTLGILVRGTLIAAPALILFGMLLSSADAAFANVLRNFFSFDFGELVLHVVTILAVGAACAGFLRSAIGSEPLETFDRPESVRIGAPETNVALALIDLLFLTFVVVQFRYFFGGASLVRIDPQLTYSDYARRGFFELAWVIALALPMLLVLEWLVDKTSLRTTRTLIGVQVALILVIAFSAYRRMQIYREAFGLTESRFYTTAFMIWIAVLLIWFSITVLTGHRERFAIGALVSAVATVVVLHAMNPDARIIATNLVRTTRGEGAFDPEYVVTHLSDDAAPLIVANLNKLPPCEVRRFDRPRPRHVDWRTWNYGRARATEAIRARRAEIDEARARCLAQRPRRPYESNATPPMR